jgi:hypothetical protein
MCCTRPAPAATAARMRRVVGRWVMFIGGFLSGWYRVPGVRELELTGILSPPAPTPHPWPARIHH